LKFKTSITRASESIIQPSVLFFRTSPSSRSNPRFMRENAILPPLCYETTIYSLRTFGSAIEIHIADSEGDPYAVMLAARLGGYVTGQDSDFVVLNTEGYAGYLPMDEMLWSFTQDVSNSTQSATFLDSADGFVVARPKGNPKKQPTASPSAQGLIPPGIDSSTKLCLNCTAYTPLSLAMHFRIPVSLLPLLGSLIGNDFTTERRSVRNLFFERNTTSAQRLSKVATALCSVLPTSPAPKRRPKKPVTSVVDVIELTVEALLANAPSSLTSGERAIIIERTIEAALQYAIPANAEAGEPNLWPSTTCVIHPPNLCPIVECMSRSLGEAEDDEARSFRADASAAYVAAYRRAELDPRIVDAVYTTTAWPQLFLEDPDLECVVRSISRPIRQWIYSILEVAVGLIAHEEDTEGGESRNSVAGEEGFEDEDELIDVIEEDSEDENGDDPLAPLRGALQELKAGTAPTPSITPSTSSRSASMGMRARPVSISEHVRRGTRCAEEKVAVKPFHRMLDMLGSEECDTLEANGYRPPSLWPTPARMSLFLRILGSDTAAIRALPSFDLVPVLTLRWVVGRLHARAAEPNAGRDREKEKWARSEARAFLSAFTSHPAVGMGADASFAAANAPYDNPAGADAKLYPEIMNRNAHLVAQASTVIEAINLLAQTLFISESAPTPAFRFSGRRFHCALTSSASPAISAKLWSAAVEGLEHTFALDKVKASKKEKKQAERQASDKLARSKSGQGMFSLLTALDGA
jgi:hypothetical protein